MNVIPSRINTRDPEFTANRVAMHSFAIFTKPSFLLTSHLILR